jgi:Ca-activated chloride channel family protein
LREIADIANGRYFRAADLPDLRDVYDQINRLERSDIEHQVFVRWQDGPILWLLPLGLALLVLERLLRHSVFQTLP